MKFKSKILCLLLVFVLLFSLSAVAANETTTQSSFKEVSSDLLQKIKDKISECDHWTDKQETKAAVDNLIRDTLWAELPECYDEISISTYRQKIYEYVYIRYKEIA